MSMSTKIEDLPGHTEERRSEIEEVQAVISKVPIQPQKDEEPLSLFQRFKNEISEENTLLLVLLVLSALPYTTTQLQRIPFISQYATSSSTLAAVIKASILLVIFIISKMYLLPKLKL